MSKEIIRDIEILNNIIEYMQNNIDKGYHKFIYNDEGYDEKCIDIINAINKIIDLYKQEKERNFHNEKSNEMFVNSYSKMAKAFNIKSYAINENIIINHIKENYISKDKIKEIVNECLEKKPDIITGKEEYCFNTNDNSFLAHKIVKLLEAE